jgi:hemerythrin-like domain-containing protein
MHAKSLSIIRDEHQALAAMLRSLGLLVARAQRDGKGLDFALFRAMLFYVDEFPERLHHPKESELLFPRLVRLAPEFAPVVERLDRDHAVGERSIRDLEHVLLAFEVMGEPRRKAFEDALERYVRSYLEHMAVEEQQILPAAQRLFSAEDWRELDAAFEANRDPLTGHAADSEYLPLFQRILSGAPAPIGLAGS